MANKTLNEILRTSQYLGTALNSMDRELGLAKKDLEHGEFQSAENDIYRSRYSLRTAMDEHNTIDSAVRKSLKLPEKPYRRINIEDKPGYSTARNREVIVPLAKPMTYSYSESKKGKDSGSDSISKVIDKISKDEVPSKSNDEIGKLVNKIKKVEMRSTGTDPYTYGPNPITKEKGYAQMLDRIPQTDKEAEDMDKDPSYYVSHYDRSGKRRVPAELLRASKIDPPRNPIQPYYNVSGDETFTTKKIPESEIDKVVNHSLGVGSDEPYTEDLITL